MTATAPLTAADYEVVIGLEVHCQLKTNTKMFCSCKNEFGGASNSHVCPVCLGLPGVLPVPNEEAIIKTLLTGEMLGCQIATRCKFDRKNISTRTCRRITRFRSTTSRSARVAR